MSVLEAASVDDVAGIRSFIEGGSNLEATDQVCRAGIQIQVQGGRPTRSRDVSMSVAARSYSPPPPSLLS